MIVATVVVAAVSAGAETGIAAEDVEASAAAAAEIVADAAVAVPVPVAAETVIVADAAAAAVPVAVETAAVVATAVIANATGTPCWAAIPTTVIGADAAHPEEGALPEAAAILLTVDSSVAAEPAANTDLDERVARMDCPFAHGPSPPCLQSKVRSSPLVALCYHRNRRVSMTARRQK